MEESIEETLAHDIRDAIVEAHLRIGRDLSDALRIGDLWDGRMVIDACATNQSDARSQRQGRRRPGPSQG